MKSKHSPEKEALLRSLETSRRQISDDLGSVGDTLNVSQRFRDSVSDNTLKWVGGGIAAGVFLAIVSPIRFRKKPRKATKERGIASGLFFSLLGVVTKQILHLSLPSLQKVAQNSLQHWLEARAGNNQVMGNADAKREKQP